MALIKTSAAHHARRCRSTRDRWAGASIPALLVALAAGGAQAQRIGPNAIGNAADCPWLNESLPVATRVNMVLSAMTIADEITLVEGQGSSNPYVFYTAAVPSLCLPALGYEDGPGGVADQLTNVTQLPASIVLSATFSRPLALQYGAVIGAEQATKGSAADLGPTVNIDRDPRWGRTFESLSEDPKLSAEIGKTEIIGIQGQRVMAQIKHLDAYNQETNRNTPADNAVVSERVLHEIYEPSFLAGIRDAGAANLMCAYSTVNGEYSCQNSSLLTGLLRDEYNYQGLVMSDYGAVHDVSAATAGTGFEQPENTFFGTPLMTAVENGSIPRATLNSLVAPLLTEMFRFDFFNNPLAGNTTAVATTPAHVATSTAVAEAGAVLLRNSDALLPLTENEDVAVIGPAASLQVTSGGGGSAHVIQSAGPTTPLDGIRALSTGNVTYTQGLPTDAQLTAIPAADLSTPYTGTAYDGTFTTTLTAPQSGTYALAINNQCGCYTNASLSVNGTAIINNPGTPPVSTYSASVVLQKGETYTLTITGETDALTWATPAELKPYYAAATAAAKAAKVAVVVVADDTETEASDRPNLSLPSAQDQLIATVAAANPHTVVVVQAGAPITMPWLDRVGAVLDTWYPGQTDGTALADLLYGNADPSGHLPITFPASLADVPTSSPAQFPGTDNTVQYSEGLLVGYRWYDKQNIAPLFPFGFGLSYTHFTFSNLQIGHGTVDGTTPVDVSATVTNDGSVAGTDAAQLYLSLPAAAGEPPRKLVDFQSVTLAPGASTTVHFTIAPRDEWIWTGRYDEIPGTYTVHVGDSSALADLPLTGRYSMTGSIGNRSITVGALRSYTAGAFEPVTVSLNPGGTQTLSSVVLGLSAPPGWQVTPVGATTYTNVLPGQREVAAFVVSPPAGSAVQNVTLYGTADFAPSSCNGADATTVATGAQTLDPLAFYQRTVQGVVPCSAVYRAAGVRARLTP